MMLIGKTASGQYIETIVTILDWHILKDCCRPGTLIGIKSVYTYRTVVATCLGIQKDPFYGQRLHMFEHRRSKCITWSFDDVEWIEVLSRLVDS